MSARTCCVAGCGKPELCGVGPQNEPMCEEHYNGWLAGTRKSTDAIFAALNRAFGKEPTRG